MSTRKTLAASIRNEKGKNVARRLRTQGVVPAIFYTTKGESTPIQINEAALMRLYSVAKRTMIFDLELDDNGKKTTHPCLFWDVEYYPTKQRFMHVDLYGVNMDKELKVRVPLEFTGVAKGTKLGGKLEVYRERIDIFSKPETLPQKITIDISDLDVGQGLRIADLAMPEGVRAAYEINFAVITVLAPGGKGDDEGDI